MPSDFVTFQSGAAGLGPVTMANPPDVAEVAMTAVQQIMARRDRAREFDLQLQRLDQQERLKEEQFGLEKRHWDQMYGVQQQRLENQGIFDRNKIDLMGQRLDFQKDVYDQNQKIESEAAGATAELHRRLSDIPYDADDPRYLQEANRIMGDPALRPAFDRKYGAGNQLAASLLRKHSVDLQDRNSREQKMFDQMMKQSGFKTDVYGAVAYDPVENPEKWQKALDDSGKPKIGRDGKPQLFWQTGPKGKDGKTPGVTMDDTDYNGLRDAYLNVRSNIIGSLKTNQDKITLARRALADPNASPEHKAAAQRILSNAQ